MENVLIEIKNLTKVFDNKNKAINNISTQFKAGQFYALLGENGAGKSTLMRLLMQNEHPTDGDIFYQGTNIYDLKNTLSYDSLYLDESMPLALNRRLLDWAEIFEKTYPSFDQNIFDKLIRILNLDASKPLMSLSRGQKVKGLFALGAARKPKLYFLDEITSVLDVGSRLNIVNFLEKEIADRQCSVIMSSNIATELPLSNTHILLLKDGEIILNCQGQDLSQLFIKYLSSSNEDDNRIIKLGGVFLSTNNDETKTFIVKLDQSTTPPNDLIEDKRRISIAEAMAYFTSGSEAGL